MERLPIITIAATVAISLFWLLGPLYNASNGLGAGSVHVLLVVCIPVLISLLGLSPQRWARVTGALLMFFFWVISGFSIGLLYTPVMVLMFILANRPAGEPLQPGA